MDTRDSAGVDGVKLTSYRHNVYTASVSEGSTGASEVKVTLSPNGLDKNKCKVTCDKDKDSDTEEEQCGCGSCHPGFLQKFAKPTTYLVCISAIVLVQSMLVSGYTGSIITTIEKRYDLWSRDIGFVMSSYDIMSMVAVIVISYYGDQHNRAKWIGRGILVMALGSVMFALPHFIGGKYTADTAYNATEMDVNLCNSTKNRNIQQKLSECTDARHTPESWMLAIFVIAQMIIGLGAAPVYTLGPTYLYDNVRPQLYSLYAG
ncbi:hypothetical protein NP493_1672g00027 [Ridgeia piscesae]|uniref:Major facilitator superfamily (MFS) profile domain-containing protein n=1 Tax=Ridgeia piscesae TaxID=27915 RepID=A0AAD9JVC4_RIDPI|nr:hypothetical protein NP493_1672g00027 [Ridgeia piscesae]